MGKGYHIKYQQHLTFSQFVFDECSPSPAQPSNTTTSISNFLTVSTYFLNISPSISFSFHLQHHRKAPPSAIVLKVPGRGSDGDTYFKRKFFNFDLAAGLIAPSLNNR